MCAITHSHNQCPSHNSGNLIISYFWWFVKLKIFSFYENFFKAGVKLFSRFMKLFSCVMKTFHRSWKIFSFSEKNGKIFSWKFFHFRTADYVKLCDFRQNYWLLKSQAFFYFFFRTAWKIFLKIFLFFLSFLWKLFHFYEKNLYATFKKKVHFGLAIRCESGII